MAAQGGTGDGGRVKPLRAFTPSDGAEEALGLRAAEGDRGAFDALVALFAGRVFAVAYRMLKDRGEAEDLAQEVFLALHQSLSTFRGESKLSTWIYRITRNRCLNRIQFLSRRRASEHVDIDDPGATRMALQLTARDGASPDPHCKLERDELRDVLEGHLLQLSEEQRMLVILRDLEDLSYHEIAEVTGLPLGTVKSRLHRARLELASRMGPSLTTASSP